MHMHKDVIVDWQAERLSLSHDPRPVDDRDRPSREHVTASRARVFLEAASTPELRRTAER